MMLPNRALPSPSTASVQVTIDPDALEAFVDEYLETALWAETDDDGRSLDENYAVYDVSPTARAAATEDCANFIAAAGVALTQYQAQMQGRTGGHDFWLTRNGHGAGFWDRGLDSLGDALSELARSFGETWITVGDDGELYLD